MVTPTGHLLVWHACAWMQPTAIIMARALMQKSAPWMMWRTMSCPEVIFPAQPSLMRSRSPEPTSALCIRMSPSTSGVPTWSWYSSGAAPVPPSEPSTTMKSGVTPSSIMALHMASTSTREPTHSLKPIGLPSESSRSRAMKRMSSRGVVNAEWLAGEMHVCPTGTPRASAISSVTLAPGSTPPSPGLAPWESLMLMALTCGRVALRRKISGSKLPSASRVPKYPEPNSQKMSASCARWYPVSPPSPVSCANPPFAAPLFMASTAFLDREPKLMEEMLSREAS